MVANLKGAGHWVARYAPDLARRNRRHLAEVREDEAMALARFHFSKIHGERAAAWHVRLGSPGGGSAAPASAIDSALLDTVKACFPRSGKAHLVSIQPYTMAARADPRALAALPEVTTVGSRFGEVEGSGCARALAFTR